MNWKVFWLGMGIFLLMGVVIAGVTTSTDTIFGKTDSTINQDNSLVITNIYSDIPVDCALFKCERVTIIDYDKNNKPTIRIDKDYLSITNQTIENTLKIIELQKRLDAICLNNPALCK